MVNRKTATKVRKIHRYLGVFLGIQFLMWTISGLYFSWTDIDEIHGDHFHREKHPVSFSGLISPNNPDLAVHSLVLKEIANRPYFWVNGSILVDARTGQHKDEITEKEALQVAGSYMAEGMKVTGVERISEAGKHHEYRGRPLPAYVVSYDHPEELKAYVSARDGSFERVRHRSWRWFDFLWMTHTMDYEGRDNFNNLLLRSFSLLGLITVLSGFALWYVSSPSVRKIYNKNKKTNGRAKKQQ
ncbi:PepSY domain-containing protein [Sinomicrobium weinanense]|uniref:PepSY domain-containing protein n=1 Tax=Sinomicrobium weinanense TaxID=2842200 RepID=A0A926JR18_9FLAO|nr:PepSY domain-containing protein [Sinomicrobium weinanense]MBC9795920.1 PepSY domain-containing protein [Sinomicrobium weinanense]MBU3124701.1 PepSY domain-containing protein [Sinomicrobium weinanense]